LSLNTSEYCPFSDYMVGLQQHGRIIANTIWFTGISQH